MSRNFAAWPLILVLGLLSLPLVIMYVFVFIDSFT
ncbi:MAG: carbohydrate ABC transporter permease, partial [Betaproteobacteria bacterium]|nr:carbohydrate ABC transporter permease [Betaproteobacteria bacterium]